MTAKIPEIDLHQVRILHSLGLTNPGIAFLLKANTDEIAEILKELRLPDNSIELKRILKLPLEEALKEWKERIEGKHLLQQSSSQVLNGVNNV
ncbi:MAG: hypothetical protein AYK18_17280 [Theionarchaea archaeon DG-70]|nr:MAG: hypothetical protein AYK18_17280 [Theionarchaea archaeon DG-70]